jgi:hypothetical protein
MGSARGLLIAAALIAGAILRIAILPIGVTAIDESWRAWSYHAATAGPARMYGPKGHTVSLGDIEVPVVYPPLALYELGIVGRVHLGLTDGRFPNDEGLTKTIKGAIVLLDAALTALIFAIVRRAGSARAAWWAAAAYWLNPAVLMMTTLGYIDVALAIPAVGALVAASSGRPWLTGALLAAAVLTKPQGLFIAPAAALALWNAGDAHARMGRLVTAAASSAVAAAIVIAPNVAAGTTYHMLRSVAVLAGHDMLSGLAANVWWIVSYLFDVAAAGGRGLRAALLVHPQVLTHAYVMERGFPNPRFVAVVLFGGAVVWALMTAVRARDLGLHAALAAFIVTAYFTLSVQVHENHFFLVLPLLVIAAALRREFRPVLAALSVSYALNLYLMFGTRGDGPPDWTIAAAGIDSTVLLAVVNCVLLAWFARIYSRSARSADAGGQALAS